MSTGSGLLTNVNKRVRSMKRSNSVSVSSTDTSPDESYIIKLLGRRVNLTTFDVDVPIYALCRSWIQDDPDAQMSATAKSRGANKVETPWNCKSSSEEICSEDVEEEFKNTYAEFSDSDDDIAFDFPPPVPLPPGVHTLRIPSPVLFPKQEIDLDYDNKSPPSKEQLLKENSERWKAVRQKWKLAAMKNERRYYRSKNMLLKMVSKRRGKSTRNAKKIVSEDSPTK